MGHTAPSRDAWAFTQTARFVLWVVVKERAHGRVVHVTTRIVYGTTAQVEAALQASPVNHTINTYGVERNNLTVR